MRDLCAAIFVSIRTEQSRKSGIVRDRGVDLTSKDTMAEENWEERRF